MDAKTIARLKKEEQDEKMSSLLNTTKSLVSISRGAMSRLYPQWDENLDTFRAKRHFSKQDERAASKDQPIQMIVPLTYSQVMTFVAFGFTLLLQNEKFYEFESTGSEDHLVEDDVEALLDRDVRKNNWQLRMFLFLLDLARLNVGVYETYWVKETLDVMVPETEQPLNTDGTPLGDPIVKMVKKSVTKFEGNRVVNISPYKFFPDTRLPLVRYQEGEFCASEEEFTLVHLKDLQHQGLVSGVDDIPEMSQTQWKDRPGETRNSHFSEVNVPSARGPGNNVGPSSTGDAAAQTKGMVHVTKVQRRLVPKDFELDGEAIGVEDYPCMYIIWYANDQRIIRYEKSTNLHDNFSYYMASYTPDHLEQLSIGLADLIDRLQSTATWLINSRITNVRRAVNNKFIIQPELIDQKSLNADSPYILLKKGLGNGGIDRAVRQLQVSDTTAGHFNDANSIMGLIQMSSGVNENSSGQYSSGRRSARQTAAVQAGESSRLIMHFTLIWEMCYGPMGLDMTTQMRQGVTKETFIRVLGKKLELNPQELEARFLAVKGTIEDLVGAEDYFLMPGTTPSEKGALAANLTELFSVIMTNPQMAMALRLDPTKVMMEIMRLRGIKHIDRFMQELPQGAPGQVPVTPPPIAGQAPPPQVMPPPSPQQQAL